MEYENIQYSDRIEKLKNFIINNPGCSISDVIKDANNKGYGSKKTIEKIIDDLISNKILRKEKEKPNSLKCQLFIEKDNLLVIVPIQLDELFSRLKIYIEKLMNMYCKPIENWPDISYAYDENNFDNVKRDMYNHLIVRIITLPILIIDIINDAFMFHYFCIWPLKIKNPIILSKLIALYFIKIADMNTYIYQEISIFKKYFPISDKFLPGNVHIYTSYADSKNNSPLERIMCLEHIDKIPFLENELSFILDYLWELNKDHLPYIYPELKTYGLIDGMLNNIDITDRSIIYDEIQLSINFPERNYPVILDANSSEEHQI